MLDDTAFNLPRDEVTDRQKRDLATALDELAAALRESTNEGTQEVRHPVEEAPNVVDAEW